MDWGKVIYVFFTLMSLTTTAGYLYDNEPVALYIAMGVNVISTILKLGIRNLLAAELLASSLVADLHLFPAFVILQSSGDKVAAQALAIGAVVANVTSISLFLIETAKSQED